jgi:hypothetical protein
MRFNTGYSIRYLYHVGYPARPDTRYQVRPATRYPLRLDTGYPSGLATRHHVKYQTMLTKESRFNFLATKFNIF